MQIKSPRVGMIEVQEEKVVTFPEGLLGFRDFKRYYFHEPSEGAALKWMQSVELPALGFVVADPRLFCPEYRAKALPEQLEGLRIAEASEAQVWVILTIPSDPAQMTANLQGPLVVNREERLGAQIVLNEEGATTKYPVLEGMRAQGAAGGNSND